MKLNLPRVFIYFLCVIFLINLIQAYFTELIFDEAYYWYYAQDMAWGYFDHPPMVAVLIKIGESFFDGEMGVRFMSTVLSAGTAILLWSMVDNPRKRDFIPHFFVLVFSMTLLHAYGFLTLPDTPLLFFTALFLVVYKKFIVQPSELLAILLGIVMAALMYSKYHAVLVILFVLLSNLKLLRNIYAWLAVLIALFCYLPHLYWLYDHDFVSIKYHLFERPNRAYDFNDFTLGYFVNLIAIFGLTFPFIYYALFKTRIKDKFSRALLFLIYGILLFFFISSFQRRIQTQWIIVICIPMVVVVYNFMLANRRTRSWIFKIGIINIAILLFLRIGLIYEPMFPIVYESHGNKEWVGELVSQVGEVPVVFENSYRKAPMYSFYSGNTSYSLNNIKYRQNQYSIDSSEAKVQGRKIVYISKYLKKGSVSYLNPKGVKHFGVYKNNFQSFRKLQCLVQDESIQIPSTELTLKVYNPYAMDIALNRLKFGVAYLNAYKQVEKIEKLKVWPQKKNIRSLKANDTTYFTFNLDKPKDMAPSYFKISISENGFFWGINGENVKLR